MPRTRSLRRPHVLRLAPPPDLRHRRARIPHLLPTRPRRPPRDPPSHGGSLISLYQGQRDLQTRLACGHARCPVCQRRLPHCPTEVLLVAPALADPVVDPAPPVEEPV